MKLIIAPDSFKGSLTSAQVSRILGDAAVSVFGNECEIRTLQIADGGEGTLSALLENLPDAQLMAKTTVGPLGIPVHARYLCAGDVAFVEMAEASGLTLVPDGERNPLRTTTYGTGELIRDAIEKGCRDIYIAIGGSATNDCGIGAMQALGFEFAGAPAAPETCGGAQVGCGGESTAGEGIAQDRKSTVETGAPAALGNPGGAQVDCGGESTAGEGETQNRESTVETGAPAAPETCGGAQVGCGGESTAGEGETQNRESTVETGAPRYLAGADLIRITAIDDSKIMPEIKECRFHVMCDVQNPLTGPQGATYTYGPQKCSSRYTDEEKQRILNELEAGMCSFSKVLAEYQRQRVSRAKPGAQAGERVTACAADMVAEAECAATAAKPPAVDGRGSAGDVAAQAGERVTACAADMVAEAECAATAAKPPALDGHGPAGDVAAQAGYGAAGGLGAALSIFLEAELRSGVDMVLELCGFDEMVRDADAVVSGEGCTDEQTLHGKVIYGIGRKCLAHNVPLWVLSGRVNCENCILAEIGVTRSFQATDASVPVADAMENAAQYLKIAATAMFREMRERGTSSRIGHARCAE